MTPAHIIQRVKESTNLQHLVESYLPMRKSGAQFLIACPWHDDSDPSCRVYSDHLFCFTCNTSADCFSFLMKMEAVTFHEALKRLADAAGISLDERPVSRVAMQFAREEAACCAWYWARRRERLMRQVYAHMETEDEEMLDIIAMPLRSDEALTVAQRFEIFRVRVTERERAEWRAEVASEREFAAAWMGLATA